VIDISEYLKDLHMKYECPWTGGVCMRVECYGSPQYDDMDCDLCGRDICVGERWEVQEHKGKEVVLCWTCSIRGSEISVQLARACSR